MNITQKLQNIKSLEDARAFLKTAVNLNEKVVDQVSEPAIQGALSLIALGEENFFLYPPLEKRLETVETVEKLYASMNGVTGYHLAVQKLMKGEGGKSEERNTPPPVVNFEEEDPSVIREGIEQLAEYAEIYPVGGAGDRLGLQIPAACLPFLGASLIELMIRDLEAREYLYFKLFGKKVIVPLLLMTSPEKENSHQIRLLLEKNGWFGRGEENFFFIEQPLVPLITEDGHWTDQLKPNGHGALWKTAKDKGAFDWLLKNGVTKAIVRQVNNPLASLDHTFLSLLGYGSKNNQIFGLVGCPPLAETKEGVLVLVHDKRGYRISNIEYTNVEGRGVEEKLYPANTNILYVDLLGLEPLIEREPFPGLVLNMKTEVVVDGERVLAGRLETSMQNLSDAVVAREIEQLKSFVAFSPREKTLSVTKNLPKEGGSTLETPVSAYNDLQKYYTKCLNLSGDAYYIYLHPATGPQQSVMRQKIRELDLQEKSEFELQLAEVDIEQVAVEGSFRLLGDEPTSNAACTLRNVKIENRGINHQADNLYWRAEVERSESFTVRLEKNAEFYAENVTLQGDHHFHVAAGRRLVAFLDGENVCFKEETIDRPSFSWDYLFDEQNRIVLKKDFS